MWQSSATGFTLQNFPSGSPQSQVENVSSLRSHICLWWTMKGRPLQHGTRHQPLTGDPGTTFSPVFVLYLVGYGTKDGPSPSSPILWYAIDSIAASASILFFVNMDCEYYVDLLDLRIWSGRRLHVSGSLCTHKSHAYFQKGFQRSDQILRNSQYTHTHTHTHTHTPHPPNSNHRSSAQTHLLQQMTFSHSRAALQVSPCPLDKGIQCLALLSQTDNLSPLPCSTEKWMFVKHYIFPKSSLFAK